MEDTKVVTDSLIAKTLHRYNQTWTPPIDTGMKWVKTVCPFHGDTIASASISYMYNAFRCHGCGITGSAVRIIAEREGISRVEAKRIADGLKPGSDAKIPPGTAGERRRRVFAQSAPSW